jgi:hypothetical protein
VKEITKRQVTAGCLQAVTFDIKHHENNRIEDVVDVLVEDTRLHMTAIFRR